MMFYIRFTHVTYGILQGSILQCKTAIACGPQWAQSRGFMRPPVATFSSDLRPPRQKSCTGSDTMQFSDFGEILDSLAPPFGPKKIPAISTELIGQYWRLHEATRWCSVSEHNRIWRFPQMGGIQNEWFISWNIPSRNG